MVYLIVNALAMITTGVLVVMLLILHDLPIGGDRTQEDEAFAITAAVIYAIVIGKFL